MRDGGTSKYCKGRGHFTKKTKVAFKHFVKKSKSPKPEKPEPMLHIIMYVRVSTSNVSLQ